MWRRCLLLRGACGNIECVRTFAVQNCLQVMRVAVCYLLLCILKCHDGGLHESGAIRVIVFLM